MNCAWYEQQLLANTELWRDGQPREEFAQHARGCAHCEATIAREIELKSYFAAVAESSRHAAPSPAMKSQLLRELDRLHPQRTAWLPRLAFALVALILVAVGIVFLRRSHAPVSPPTQIAVAPAQSKPVEPSAVPAPKVATAQTAPRKFLRTPARKNAAASNADFTPVVMCDPLTCAGPAMTVRVELPASPLAAGDSSRKITADLLVGEDGLVRAVRVLQ